MRILRRIATRIARRHMHRATLAAAELAERKPAIPEAERVAPDPAGAGWAEQRVQDAAAFYESWDATAE